jgi:DNA helicase-2/ATP-dependent DNA helicase PcrA
MGLEEEMKLNRGQQDVVCHTDGACLIAACPGSGKTRTITERVKRIVLEQDSGRNILNITFTNKAAKEMKKRLVEGVSLGSGSPLLDVTCSTFHSLALSMMRKFSYLLNDDPNITILDTDSVISVLSGMDGGANLDQKELRALHGLYNNYRESCNVISDIYDHFKDEEANLFVSLEEYFKLSNSIDFSGMLYRSWDLLTKFDEVSDFMTKRFRYVQVDEFQDTNLIQLEIVKKICQHNNVVAVGDQDQAIYGWRGARPENMKDFLSAFDPVRIINLNINYRSTPEILKVANCLISNSSNRINDDAEAHCDSGDDVKSAFCDSREKEAQVVASQIKHYVDLGYKPKDMAVLYRTNSMSRGLELSLTRTGIPYIVIGAFSFYDREEVRDVLCYLKLLFNPRDWSSFSRICNKPKIGFGPASINKLKNFCKDNSTDLSEINISDLNFLKASCTTYVENLKKCLSGRDSCEDFSIWLQSTLDRMGYDDFLLKDRRDKYDEKSDNLIELIRSAAIFSRTNKNDLSKYLQQIMLFTSSDKTTDDNVVSLISLHSSKGLEFPIVFLIGLDEGILPHKRAVESRIDGLEEERRLCYVGMTRAEKILHTTSVISDNSNDRRSRRLVPSRFLMESGILDENQYNQIVYRDSQ